MTAKLSSKGQVVLPKQARMRLHQRAGVKFVCKVQGHSILPTPEHPVFQVPRLIQDPKSGLRITNSPAETRVTSEDVRAALLDFP
jgi:bifunctional DNA-binding transcriptional regulator/antitoxin component of YhaV-PrlF toxin-antitoxin module